LKGLIYDFGPDGTEFSEPATLTLPAAGTPGDDEEAVIAWLDESTNTWKNLETTVNADGSLSADIVHFTQFVVRFNGVVTDDCGFEACGGNVVGTWNVTGVCAKGTTELEDICPDAVAEIDLQLSGTATFESDGTRTTNFTSKATITYTLSADCLSEITEGMPPASCDDLSKEADPEEEKGPTTCSGDPEVSCTCVEEGLEKTETKTGGYEIDGKSITMISEDGDEDVLEFCVDGDEARFQQTDGLAVITWIAERR